MEEIEKLRWDIKELNNSLNNFGIVKVINGNGRKIMYKREEFEQMIYDGMKWRWKDTVKDITIIMSLVVNVGLVLRVFGLI